MGSDRSKPLDIQHAGKPVGSRRGNGPNVYRHRRGMSAGYVMFRRPRLSKSFQLPCLVEETAQVIPSNLLGRLDGISGARFVYNNLPPTALESLLYDLSKFATLNYAFDT